MTITQIKLTPFIYNLYEVNPLNQMIIDQLIAQTVRKNKSNSKDELFQFYLGFLFYVFNARKSNKTSFTDLITSNPNGFNKMAQKSFVIDNAIISMGIKSKLIDPSDVLFDFKKRISYPLRKKHFKDFQDFHNIFTRVNNKLWHCTQNMSYPDFYQAWHQKTMHQGEYN